MLPIVSYRIVLLIAFYSYVCTDGQWEIKGNGAITTNRICKDYIVELCNRKLAVDLIVLDTRGYDLILGMTWLSKYHAVIDCQNKSNFQNVASARISIHRRAQVC